MKHLILTAITLIVLINSNIFGFWQWVSSGLGGNYPVQAISSSGNNLFVGTNLFSNGSLYYSSNNGMQWHNIFTNNADIFAVSSRDNFVFMATDNGIYRTKNFGVNWEQCLNNNFIFSSITNNNSASNIIAGCYYGGLGKIVLSTNYGTSWMQSSLNNAEILSLYSTGTTVFAGTNGYGVYKSTNGGFNWSQTSLNNNSVISLTANGNYIFAGTMNGLYRSTNNGLTWDLSSLSNIPVFSLAQYNNYFFAGVYDISNFYFSSNNGQSWTYMNDGILDPEFSSVRAIHIANNYIFIGVSNSNYNGVYRRPIGDIISVQQISNSIPINFALSQNYPNPFNPATKIGFSIPLSRGVSGSNGQGELTNLLVFDLLGREIETLVNEQLKPGTYEVDFDGSNYPSGVYYYKLTAGDFTETKKMILIK